MPITRKRTLLRQAWDVIRDPMSLLTAPAAGNALRSGVDSQAENSEGRSPDPLMFRFKACGNRQGVGAQAWLGRI